jgi:hypothetical protein
VTANYGLVKSLSARDLTYKLNPSCPLIFSPVRRTLPSSGRLINLVHFIFLTSNKFLLSPPLAFLIIRKCDTIILPLNKREKRKFHFQKDNYTMEKSEDFDAQSA